MPQKRYAAIDDNSGYAWGACYADSPLEAARLILDEADGCRHYRVEAVDYTDPRGSLDVYEIPDHLEIFDGQDQETIDAVERCPRVLTVSVMDAEGRF